MAYEQVDDGIDRRTTYQRLAEQATTSSSKTSIVDDYEAYKQYYSTDRLTMPFCFKCGRSRSTVGLFVAIVILLILLYSRRHAGISDFDASEQKSHKPTKTLGGKLACDAEHMKPSATLPNDVNKVRPADLKVIAAMGDSITVASLSKNYEDEPDDIYPGNSYAIGGDETLKEHITVANILREFNPSVVGMSHGVGYGGTAFNVAVGGMTSEDLPRQAQDLVDRMKKKAVSLSNDWKLVTIFIGTNDIAKLRCFSKREPVSREVYKAKIEEAISLLRDNLNRTIISIVSIWNSQLVFDAESLIDKGKRMQCGDHYMEKRDALCDEYRKVVYEIQNERRFDRPDFTVVVQGFMDEIKDAFRNKEGVYDKSFYGADMFHLSKYGNAVMGKFLWNAMLQPVGRKNPKPDLGDDSAPLSCPTKERPFIQTLGNMP